MKISPRHHTSSFKHPPCNEVSVVVQSEAFDDGILKYTVYYVLNGYHRYQIFPIKGNNTRIYDAIFDNSVVNKFG